MELIDRYLYAVTSHLPEDIREDVKRELQANIEDMLPETPSESDILEALKKLGNPVKLADEYRQVKRYLIGPGLYDQYLSVLKLVISITSVIFASIALMKGIINSPILGSPVEVSIKLFTNTLTSVIEGTIQAALWVTLIFAILERTGIDEGKLPFTKNDWSPEDLPSLSEVKKLKISRSETAISMICIIFFTSLLYFNPQLIALYTKGQNGLTMVTPLFVTEHLNHYILIIVCLSLVEFSILIYKFITTRWSIPLAIADAAHNIAISILVCVMATDNSLINENFISEFSNLTNLPLSQISEVLFKTLWGFAIVFVIISLWESIKTFVKLRK